MVDKPFKLGLIDFAPIKFCSTSAKQHLNQQLGIQSGTECPIVLALCLYFANCIDMTKFTSPPQLTSRRVERYGTSMHVHCQFSSGRVNSPLCAQSL